MCPEIDPDNYGQLTLDKVTKAVQCGMNSLFK